MRQLCSPKAGLATVASIGHASIGLLDQEVARAGLDWDCEVPDQWAIGRRIGGNLLAILVNLENL